MSTKERFEKYVEEHCKHCKNKCKNDCEVRIHNQGNIVVTKCDYYERED